MNRTEALIKGLQILNAYNDCEVYADHDIVFAGPQDHRVVLDSDASILEDLGWYATSQWGWAFNV